MPLRHAGQVGYIGGFWAQWEPGVTELRYVSRDFLLELVRKYGKDKIEASYLRLFELSEQRLRGAIAGQAFRAGVPISAGTDNLAPWDDPWPDLLREALDKLKASHPRGLKVLLPPTTSF